MNKYNGLTDAEVIENRKNYGSNKVEGKSGNVFLSLLIESLGDPIIKILLIALAIKIVFLFRDFDWFETLGILIAIFLSSFISTISEYGSEKAFKKLQEESSKLKCKVLRNGKQCEVLTDDVVKDDLVIIEQGDKVPADGVIIDGKLSVDESSINGEAKEVHKEKYLSGPILNKNKLFRGTVIYEGKGIFMVTSVGDKTFYGKIAMELQETAGESPLKLRLRNLAKIISTFGYIGAFLASFSFLFSKIVVENNFDGASIISTLTNLKVMFNYALYALTLSVTIIIVSVPEGLPMMITLVLSSNMRRMIKNNVLVRKLVGIETAGSLNILFSDKTGTITTGRLNVTKIIDGDLNEYQKEEDVKTKKRYYDTLRISVILNNMSSYEDDKIIGGNITDKCLLSFFKPFSYQDVKVLRTINFNSKKKYMITVTDHSLKNLIKGAPEIIVKNCRYYIDKNGVKSLFTNKNKIINYFNEEAKKGNRVIALAASDNNMEELFENLTFIGLVVIKDEIRKESFEGIKRVSLAGVKTVMITGDNKDTAVSIAKEVGLIRSDKDIILTSKELGEKSDADVKMLMPNLKVVARSLPQDKSRLVRLAKEMNLVVGMTGDGVNDAPALKKADVGFSMGTGSEVSKEASDIVILDNNFLSISTAILFGRTIFKSIRKFIIFQLTVNLCALSVSIIAPFIGINTPITVIQMLWINMVMDTLAGLAFAFEPPLLEYMKEKPKKKDENIINGYMVNEILITGCYTTLLCLMFLKIPFVRSLFSSSEAFMTAFFGLFIFSGIFNCFNARTRRLNIISNLSKNKMFVLVISFIIVMQIMMMYLWGDLFRTVPLNLEEFLIMFGLSFSVVPFDMLRKKISKKLGKSFGV